MDRYNNSYTLHFSQGLASRIVIGTSKTLLLQCICHLVLTFEKPIPNTNACRKPLNVTFVNCKESVSKENSTSLYPTYQSQSCIVGTKICNLKNKDWQDFQALARAKILIGKPVNILIKLTNTQCNFCHLLNY